MDSASQAVFPTRRLPRASALITSFALSVLPISLIWRLRWNSRFGLDYLHLLLIQLIFFILARRLSSPRKSTRATVPAPSQPRSHTSARAHSQDTSSNSSLRHPESPQDSLHRKTVKTLLEVIEPGLLPANERTSAQPSTSLPDWQPIFVDPTRPIHASQHPSIPSLYAVMMVLDGIEVESLVRCLRENKQWQWDRMCECGGDLGGGISWVRMKGSWPIKPKDMVMYSTSVRLPPSATLRVLFASTTTTHPLKQSDVSVKYAGYLVEPAPDDPSSCQFTLIIDLAGFGSLPTFVIKAILTKYIPSSIRTIHKLAQGLGPPTEADKHHIPALWNPSESSNEKGHSSTLRKEDEPLRELVGQLKQLLSTLSAIHRPPTASGWTDRAWLWAGSAGLMVSSGIALKIIKQARDQQNPR